MYMKLKFILYLSLILLCFCSCKEAKTTYKFATYNTQTFFDANIDGTEYKQFIDAKGQWNKEAYIQRLKRLCHILKEVDADVIALQEIENADMIYDIFNYFEGYISTKKRYRYAAFEKAEDASIGCAVLSRFPLKDKRVHTLDIRVKGAVQPPLRPTMELTVQTPQTDIKLFVLHWKSKAGNDNGQSKIWRQWQERQLSQLFEDNAKLGLPCIAVGDLNQDISEFSLDKEKNRVMLYNTTPVQSVWLMKQDIDYAGSYYFRDKWEKIDHVFFNDNCKIEDFVVNTGDWVDEDGIPIAFKLWTLTGYSDHLPLSFVVNLSQ